jgi:hypothetical protein
MPQGELKLTQSFQTFTGTFNNAPISDGKLNGAEISFTTSGTRYAGRVNGNTMEGTVPGGGQWKATR